MLFRSADYFYHNFPDKDEGDLTKLRSKMVSRHHLNELAAKMDVEDYVRTKLSGADKINTILGNTLEALIGAAYLDRGYDYAKNVIIQKLVEADMNLEEFENHIEDYKSSLIEWGQKYKKRISFSTQEEEHDPKEMRFKSTVLIDGVEHSTGSGTSKKKAEQLYKRYID